MLPQHSREPTFYDRFLNVMLFLLWKKMLMAQGDVLTMHLVKHVSLACRMYNQRTVKM